MHDLSCRHHVLDKANDVAGTVHGDPFPAAAISRQWTDGQLGEDRLQRHGERVEVGSLPGLGPLIWEKSEPLPRVGAADDR